MKKIYLIISILLLLIISFIIYNCSFKFLFKDKEETKISVNYTKQEKITKELKKYINNKKYTIDNPKIIVDPYKTSPLTALIFFTTKDKKEIKLYINESFVTTMEKAKYHVVPIYGLMSNHKNKITLELDNNKYDYFVDVNLKQSLNKSTYELNYEPDEYLMLNTSNGKYAIDNNKNIVWKSSNSTLDIQFINSYQYLIADYNNRVIKTDLLGQVYDVYYDYIQNENHKIKYYDNNMIITTPEYHLKSINIDTGKINFDIDVNKIFTSIDKNFASTQSEFKKANLYNLYHMNNYEYNKDENTILLSLRGINAVVNYDISKNQIIWIFSDNKIFKSNFDKYKLNLINGNYVHGQHTPYLDGNKLYIFDNNYSTTLKGNARGVIYEIDGMNIKEIYSYNSEYKSSLFGGSFYEKDDIKQINFGSVLGNSGSYEVLELDKNNKVAAQLKYRIIDVATAYSAFRHKFYEEKTNNYEFKNIKKIDFENNNGNLIGLKLRSKLKKAQVDENLISIEKNSIKVSSKDKCTIMLIGKDNMIHKIRYNDNLSYNNIKSYLTTIKGKYAIYVKFDDNKTIYNTNKIINIY